MRLASIALVVATAIIIVAAMVHVPVELLIGGAVTVAVAAVIVMFRG